MSEKRNKNNLLKVIGASAAAAGAAYGGFSYYVFRNAFDLQGSKLYGIDTVSGRISGTFDEKAEWFAHSTRDDEFLDSYDGLKLHALRVTNHPESHKWIIMQHGFGQYSGDLLGQLYEADHRGYNLLAPDARGCGMSDGRYTGLGWNEHYDLISWINYLLNIDADAEIALYGLNIGAVSVMNALGDYLPANVKCAVEDGGFSGIWEFVNYSIKKYCKVDGKPFKAGIDFLVKQFLHYSMNDVSVKRQLQESTVPTLFMHGTDDTVVPTSMLFDNYYACAAEKELYTAENKGFGNAFEASDYCSYLFGFIEKYM